MNDRSRRQPGPATLISRRGFLRRAATATLATAATVSVVPRHILGGAGFTAPADRLNLAVVGVGGRGKRLINGIFRHDDAQIIAIADPSEREDYSRFYYRGVAGRLPVKDLVEKHYAEKKGPGEYSRCADYVDFRELLDRQKAIDAVMIATPDHAHAFIALAAMGLGKHVYCEKPLTHSVEEARVVTEAARRAKVATQMGNQGNSGEGIRQTCEWIWADVLGEVREVHAWSGAGDWLRGMRSRPKATPAVPVGLDWQMWLGPAADRPYHPTYAPYDWRGWWDFGTGAIGDMGCHNIDPAVAALKLEHPDTVEGTCTQINPETTPHGTIIHFTFPARGDMPPVKLTWYDGGLRPPRPEELRAGQNLDGEGILFVGSKGKLLLGGWSGNPRLLPESRMKDFKPPPRTLRRVAGHDRAWLDACKGGPPASSNFNYSGTLAELVLIGMVALRTGEKLHWDGPNLRATNTNKAEEFVRQEYRSGWSLQESGAEQASPVR